MNIEMISIDILEDLRERGIKDVRLKEMTPFEVFTEYCMWHGIIGYSGMLWNAVENLKKADDRSE